MESVGKLRTNRPKASFKPTARSRITNGSAVLPNVDGRTVWVRRLRDLIGLHLSDIGGEECASEAEKSIIRRAACLTVELEQLERTFAENDGATIPQLEAYQRASNSLRRLLDSIGLKRRARDITPDPLTYAKERSAA